MTTDAELMRALGRGRAHALDELCSRHQGGLYTFFRRLGAAPHDAEDAVQEVFLRLHRAARTYRPLAPFRAYLYVIARNVWCDAWRLASRRPSTVPPRPEECITSDGRREREERMDLHEAIDGLPMAQRLVLTLSLHGGLKHKEIADVLGIPEGTVKSRMFHAVRKLEGRLHAGQTTP